MPPPILPTACCPDLKVQPSHDLPALPSHDSPLLPPACSSTGYIDKDHMHPSLRLLSNRGLSQAIKVSQAVLDKPPELVVCACAPDIIYEASPYQAQTLQVALRSPPGSFQRWRVVMCMCVWVWVWGVGVDVSVMLARGLCSICCILWM